jgi:hypothetical protein
MRAAAQCNKKSVHVWNEQLAVQKLARVGRRVVGKQPLFYLRPIVGETIRGNNGIGHRHAREGGVAELGGGVVASRRGLRSDCGMLHAARAAIDCRRQQKWTFCDMERLCYARGDGAQRARLRLGTLARAPALNCTEIEQCRANIWYRLGVCRPS